MKMVYFVDSHVYESRVLLCLSFRQNYELLCGRSCFKHITGAIPISHHVETLW